MTGDLEPEIGPQIEPEIESEPEPTVGWPAKPRISREARRANRAGLKAHRNGRYEAAKAAFARAVAASPDHDFARYNLACALARLGALTEAAEQLAVVLPRDPARFAHRIEGDEDLAALRDDSAYAGLRAALPRVRAAWSAAHDRGVPAMMYRYRARRIVDFALEGGVDQLVVGAYVHEPPRFVPIARGGSAAFVDLPARRVMTVGFGYSVSAADNEPILTIGGVQLRDTDPTAAPLVDAAMGSILPKHEESPIVMFGGRFAMTPEAIYGAVGWAYYLEYDQDEDRQAFVLDRGGVRFTREPWPTAAQLNVMQGGAVVLPPRPEGVTFERGRLAVAGKVAAELPGIHHSPEYDTIALDSTRSVAVVTSLRWHDAAKDHDTPKHAIHRVDLSSGEVVSLSVGNGVGLARIGPDDAIYVQAGGKTARWIDAQPAHALPLMDGLRLTTPLEPYDCGPCG